MEESLHMLLQLISVIVMAKPPHTATAKFLHASSCRQSTDLCTASHAGSQKLSIFQAHNDTKHLQHLRDVGFRV